jgi:hypothetical protein
MNGLDLFGAAENLSNQYLVLHIKGIDADVLKKKIGGTKGAIAAASLSIVNREPKAVLDILSPIISGAAKSYGVDADLVVTNVPPSKGGRALSEFWPGLVAGAVLGGSILAIVKLIQALVSKKTSA